MEGNLCARGEGDFSRRIAGRPITTTVAGFTLEAIGELLSNLSTLFEVERQSISAVAAAAATRHFTILIPMAESFFRSSEVAMINALQG